MDDTTPDVTVGYDDGWIAVTGALAVSMTEQLDCVRTSPAQQQYELEPGQLQVDPTGETPEFLTALDGKTQLPLSPQLREFYGYARWSSGSVTLLEVQDPVDFLDLLTDPQVNLPGVLRSEFTSPGVLVDARGQGLDPSRCALLMVDSVTSSPHSRAYRVFGAPEHSRVGTLIAANERSGGAAGTMRAAGAAIPPTPRSPRSGCSRMSTTTTPTCGPGWRGGPRTTARWMGRPGRRNSRRRPMRWPTVGTGPCGSGELSGQPQS